MFLIRTHLANHIRASSRDKWLHQQARHMTAPDRNRHHARKCLTARRRPHTSHAFHRGSICDPLAAYSQQRDVVTRRLSTEPVWTCNQLFAWRTTALLSAPLMVVRPRSQLRTEHDIGLRFAVPLHLSTLALPRTSLRELLHTRHANFRLHMRLSVPFAGPTLPPG
jgi:hypothetical protein